MGLPTRYVRDSKGQKGTARKTLCPSKNRSSSLVNHIQGQKGTVMRLVAANARAYSRHTEAVTFLSLLSLAPVIP